MSEKEGVTEIGSRNQEMMDAGKAKHRPGIDAPKYEAIHSSTDPVEMLAYDLAVELEQAELDVNDYVTVNRAKLRAIAERILARSKSYFQPTT